MLTQGFWSLGIVSNFGFRYSYFKFTIADYFNGPFWEPSSYHQFYWWSLILLKTTSDILDFNIPEALLRKAIIVDMSMPCIVYLLFWSLHSPAR